MVLSKRAEGLIAINIAAVIFGSAALFGKLEVSPVWIVAMRALFAAIALTAFGIIKSDLGTPDKKHFPSLLLSGFLLAIHWVTFFGSVQLAGVAVATIAFAAFPLFTVLIETFSESRKLNIGRVVACLAIIGAVSLLINPTEIKADIAGITMGLVSAVTFSVFGYSSRNLGHTLSPLRISLFQNIIVAIILSPFLFIALPAPAGAHDWIWLSLLGIVTTAIMHQLYFYSMRRLSASTCGGFVSLEPVYAIVFAALFFGEELTIKIALSAALILLASFTLLKMDNTTSKAS